MLNIDPDEFRELFDGLIKLLKQERAVCPDDKCARRSTQWRISRNLQLLKMLLANEVDRTDSAADI
ncbi:hypothetical protein BJP62_05945 [Jeongeupia sp. USM3]|nr:hypothetical protein BJP62_05945 [Jeongeupia sp. USM3]